MSYTIKGNDMRRVCFLFLFTFLFVSCVTLKEPEVIIKQNIMDYKYIVINSTESINSSAGSTVNGSYYSVSKTVNPKDFIAGNLIKKGFIILPTIQEEFLENTAIVNYGEVGRRNIAGGLMGYTIEVSIQFIDAKTKEIICVSTAEGIGTTESDDIREAITRALNVIF